MSNTVSQILLENFDIEVPITRRLLERVPSDTPDYKPHEKSMPLGRLAVHVATLPALGTLILTTPGCDVATARFPDSHFVSTEKLLADFDTYSAETRAALAASSDADLAHLWKFSAAGHVLSHNSRSCSFQHMFFGHLSHHRAQLGVYLRLLNLPLPGIYGPSADERPGA
jgi:uncharacterized damage-inducible protein DinB